MKGRCVLANFQSKGRRCRWLERGIVLRGAESEQTQGAQDSQSEFHLPPIRESLRSLSILCEETSFALLYLALSAASSTCMRHIRRTPLARDQVTAIHASWNAIVNSAISQATIR